MEKKTLAEFVYATLDTQVYYFTYSLFTLFDIKTHFLGKLCERKKHCLGFERDQNYG